MTDTTDILREFPAGTRRRALLQGLVAMGAGGASFLSFAEALAQAQSGDVAQITILSQPGAVPDILRDATFPLFRQTHPNTTVNLEIAPNAAAYPRMLTQRANPVISGGMFNDIFAQRGRADGMFASFNREFVPNASKLPSGLTTPGGLGIPFHLSPFAIMYNPDRMEAPTSWTDLYNPRLRGRVAMWDAYYDAYIMAAVADGKPPTVEDGIRAWQPHRANIGAWVNSPIVAEDMVARGEMWAAPHWGSFMGQARARGGRLAFAVPREGGVQWTGHMQVCTGFNPRVTELTQRYLNTWLSDECQMAWITRGFFSPASTTVQVPENLRGESMIMSAEEAGRRLIKPDVESIGPAMPRLTALIQRTLRG
ncbi:MAG TPA: extracellular solute-binding protein [Acetobacteraceae bacterium]|nr:extracellular solute-binding protein [Acetobacteraceae bacterium]